MTVTLSLTMSPTIYQFSSSNLLYHTVSNSIAQPQFGECPSHLLNCPLLIKYNKFRSRISLRILIILIHAKQTLELLRSRSRINKELKTLRENSLRQPINVRFKGNNIPAQNAAYALIAWLGDNQMISDALNASMHFVMTAYSKVRDSQVAVRTVELHSSKSIEMQKDLEEDFDPYDEPCYVCGRNDDFDHLLECEYCQAAFCHTYCDTRLQSDIPPEESWYCLSCSSLLGNA